MSVSVVVISVSRDRDSIDCLAISLPWRNCWHNATARVYLPSFGIARA